MKFACPNCAQRLEAEPHMAGAQIACPACNQALTIPSSINEDVSPFGVPPLGGSVETEANRLKAELQTGKRLRKPVTVAAAIAAVFLVLGASAFYLLRGRSNQSSPAASLLALFDRADVTELKVFPAEINLRTKQDRQSLVVQAIYSDGATRDVTANASFSFSAKGLAKLEKQTVHPTSDGKTILHVKYSGRTVELPVTVEQAKVERPISFKMDIMPVFMKAGCNSGNCHGASRGKDGFHLSLFGYDPDGDYFKLTQENVARRINLAIPEESLIIEKALGAVPHTGGERFKRDGELCQTLLQWLKEGAPKDTTNVANVVDLEIMPKEAVLEGSNSTHRLTVRAKYSDGSDRDVTSLAVFLSNNEPVAKVSETGIVTAGQRGESFIMARFDTLNVGAQFIVVPKNLPYTFPAGIAEYNYIDALVHAKLKKLRIVPSELCDDATFIRRATIDITGQLPTVEEVKEFMEEPSTGKRDQLIERLLERQEFADLWVMKWAELLQIRSRNDRFSSKSARVYYDWLQEQLGKNVPIDRIVQDLITASGSTFKNPAASYYQVQTDTLKTAENVAQVFMGMRIQCAQCHNHPFDRWTMNDYYSFAAFFPQVGRKQGDDPRESIIFDRGEGEVSHPVGKRVMAPKFLGGDEPQLQEHTRRQVLAKWLASPDNPYFARNLANIMWAHFMGKGIIEPVDDVRISNPASNPELLDALGAKLTEYKYDFKKLVRDICTSRAYQLSTRANDSNALDDRNFARASIRRVRAEVLLDCISQVTETKDKFPGLPRGARAVEIADGAYNNFFLTTFGRATRETVCSCEVKTEPNLSQALHLLNGNTVQGKIDEGGLVKKLLKQGKKPIEVAEDLYFRCLARKPSDQELATLNKFLHDTKDEAQVLNDLFWSVLNSKEFIFNH